MDIEIPRRKPAVLIVDDDFDIRELMVDLLVDDGFEVVAAKDGREALLELRSRPVKLILLDINMPVMDGVAFRAEQLSDPELAAIPVIVLSANDDYAGTDVARNATAYFKKPFLPDQLLDAIARFR